MAIMAGAQGIAPQLAAAAVAPGGLGAPLTAGASTGASEVRAPTFLDIPSASSLPALFSPPSWAQKGQALRPDKARRLLLPLLLFAGSREERRRRTPSPRRRSRSRSAEQRRRSRSPRRSQGRSHDRSRSPRRRSRSPPRRPARRSRSRSRSGSPRRRGPQHGRSRSPPHLRLPPPARGESGRGAGSFGSPRGPPPHHGGWASPRGPPPGVEEAPEVGSIHHARVHSVRPFGVFVELPGFRKQGLVHHTQVRGGQQWRGGGERVVCGVLRCKGWLQFTRGSVRHSAAGALCSAVR